MAEPLRIITAILPGSKWSCLLLRIVLQDASSEVTKIYPPLKLRVFVDDITALSMEKNEKVAEMAKKVRKKLTEEVEKNASLSVNEKGKEATSKTTAPCGFLEDELRQCSKEGQTIAYSVETLGVDLRTRVKRLGAKLGANEKARKTKCRMRFSIIKKNKVFQKSYTKVGVKKLSRAGMVPASSCRVHAVGMAPTERFESRRQMASSGEKRARPRCLCSWRPLLLRRRKISLLWPPNCWAEGVWMQKMASRNERSLEKADLRGSDVEATGRTCRSGHHVAVLAYLDFPR